MKKGLFIVIDGTDGSGKKTQADLLIMRLQSATMKRRVKLWDFPQYGMPSAYFVEKYLRGEYGDQKQVGVRAASLFYALDRFDASTAMREWLAKGNIIVSNRYVSSNMGHQAGQISDPDERKNCVRWIKEIEYGILQLPVPDVNILLYLPPDIGQKLVDRKPPRAHMKGKRRDIHEENITHLRRASVAYLAVAEKEKWKIIHCANATKTGIRPIEEIHDDVWKSLPYYVEE